MPIEGVSAIAMNAMVATLLINSGAAKLVSPGGLRAAVRELFPLFGGAVTNSLVRAAAILEIVVAAGLLVEPSRLPAAVLLAPLAITFTVLGGAGAIRGSTTACGCFGTNSDRPLGLGNLLIGLALLPVVVLNLAGSAVAAGYTPIALAVTAAGSLLMGMWLNRGLAADLLRERAARA